MPLKTYDESISVLRQALDRAKVGDSEKIEGFRRLEQFVRLIEQQCDVEADVPAVIRHENRISRSLGGRSVFDDRKPVRSKQLGLFDA